ncbi:shikimate kinase, partial [Microbacterium sp. HM58-2]
MRESDSGTPLIVVMGVSGCGKSTVGAALAAHLRVPFRDADDLHPTSNVDKMSRGIPLTDHDRAPWLAAVGEELALHRSSGMVIACSALKAAYRDILRTHAPGVFFVHLSVSKDVLAERMSARADHYMPLSLLESQLDTLEALTAGEGGIAVDAEQRVVEIVEAALRTIPYFTIE